MTRSSRLRLIVAIAAVALVLVVYIDGRHWLSVDSLRSHRDALMQFVSAHYWESLLLVGGLCVALVALSVPISAALMLVSGMVFSRWVGSVLMIITTSLGATLALLVVRYLAEDFVRARLKGHRRAQQLLKGFDRHEDSYLLFLRLVPGFPFWLTNILFGLTDISALRFLLLTLIGISPDALIYCNVGANLATLKSAHDLMSPASIAALALLALLCLTPVLIHLLQRRGLLHAGWPFRRGS
jgi:uncharacterized membrane protein YdjX (TVP38/TMEM64 family)